jgi:hypothetical protein
MHHADCAHVGGCAEPHHGKPRNWVIKGAIDSCALPHLSDVETPGGDDGDPTHGGVNDDLDIPVIELCFGQVKIVTMPVRVRILVRRPTCQRPLSRTSPIEVEISNGS